jgi:acetyl-CoA carboxylase biotin carboxyl carrier protein
MDGHNRHNPSSHSDEHARGASVISIKQLQHLIRLFDRSDVTELELKRPEEGIRLVLRKVKASSQSDEQVVVPATAVANSSPPPETKHNVVAPLVGVFHVAAKPKGKPLVGVGDRVKVGQHVAAIESLNVINEVEAPVAGRIIEILIQEGQPVEYGQLLMTIDSAEGA